MLNLKALIGACFGVFIWLAVLLLFPTTALAQQDHPPVIKPIAKQYVVVDETMNVTITATDEDGDALLIQLLDTLPGLNLSNQASGTANLTWTPTENQIGNHKVRVQAVQSVGAPNPSEIVEIEIVVAQSFYADLVVDKSRQEPHFFTNSTGTFDIAIENRGNFTATSVVLTDVLSGLAGVVIRGLPQGYHDSCDLDLQNLRQLVCQLGDIAAGGKVTLITPVATGDEPGIFANRATATTTTNDANLLDNSDDEFTEVRPPNFADVAIAQEDAPTVVVYADPIDYTLTVRNFGTSDVPTTTVTVSISGPGRFVFWDKQCVSPTDSSLTCTLKDLGITPVALNTVIRPTDDGLITLSASIVSDLYDPATHNNGPTTVAVEVSPNNADLLLLKTANTSVAQVGDYITYNLLARNQAADAVYDVEIQDLLPPGLTLVRVVVDYFKVTCVHAPNIVRCGKKSLQGSGPSVPPQDYETLITYIAQANAVGTFQNTAVVSATNNIDPVPADNSAFHVLTVLPPTVNKVGVIINGTPITPTGTTTSTGTISNTGNFSKIPIRIEIDGEEQEAETDENGQAEFELGEKPQKISVSTAITPGNFSDTEFESLNMQINFNQMPPTGDAELSSSQAVTTGLMLYLPGGGNEQHAIPGNQFSWQDRNDVNTGSISLTVPIVSDEGEGRRLHRDTSQTNPIDITLAIDAVWEHTLYLPTIMR